VLDSWQYVVLLFVKILFLVFFRNWVVVSGIRSDVTDYAAVLVNLIMSYVNLIPSKKKSCKQILVTRFAFNKINIDFYNGFWWREHKVLSWEDCSSLIMKNMTLENVLE